MSKVLPHSRQIQVEAKSYLDEINEVTVASVAAMASHSQFSTIYKTCLALDSVLAKLASSRAKPGLNVARAITQKIPLLVSIGQMDACYGELRRLIEVTFWCIYFTQHPVEWRVFIDAPHRGFSRDLKLPITYCAFQSRQFYFDYAAELFSSEPSGMAKDALVELSNQYSNLSGCVHASSVVHKAKLFPVACDVSGKELERFAKDFRIICRDVCIVYSAYFRTSFDALPAVHRAWFNWLLGSEKSKKVRSGKFGLQN